MDGQEARENVVSILEQEASAICSCWRVAKSDRTRIVFRCKDKKCRFRIGYSLKMNGWDKIRTWCASHSEGCVCKDDVVATVSGLRKRAAKMAVMSGDASSRGVELMYKYMSAHNGDLSNRARREIYNSSYYVRRVYGLTQQLQEKTFPMYLEMLGEQGFHVSVSRGRIRIIAPYSKQILNYFYSPVFVDGTSTSDGKSIIHASSVTTTNTLILLGLVVCNSEDAVSAKMLLDGLVGEKTPTFITDEGKGILKAIEMLGDKCKHMLCAWHLAKQLPKQLETKKGKISQREIRDLFYSTARGTVTRYEDFYETMGSDPETRDKFHMLRNKWCRRFSASIRRDYISTLSESLNGAIKRTVRNHSWVALTKGFLEHSMRAYEESRETAKEFIGLELMPLVHKYYEVDKDVSKSLTYREEGNIFKILFRDSQVATVRKNNGKFICDCNQLLDIGTVCAHILTVEDVNLLSYTHEMWLVKTYLNAFQSEEPKIGSRRLFTTPHFPHTTNQAKIINAVQRHKTISNQTTRRILELLGEK